MKYKFLVIAVGAFSFASAQNNNLDTFWIKTLPSKPKTDSELPQIYSYNSTPLDQAKLLHTLPNGNKIYALPQDNMPCVVPDMTQYTTIPTVKPNVPLYSIPNPSLPPFNKPKVLSPEQLQKLLEMQKQRK